MHLKREFQLLLLAISAAAGAYVRTSVSPLQEAIRISLSLSDNQMAVLQGPAVGIPMALCAVPLGLVIDRYVRTRLLVIVAILILVGSLATAVAPGFIPLMLARALSGVAGLASFPIALSFLADLYPPSQRGRATMVVVVGQVAGNSAAFALGGALLGALGGDPTGWRRAMLGLCIPLIAVVLSTFALREPARTGVSSALRSTRQAWRELWEYVPIVGPLLIGIVLIEIGIGALLTWVAPTLTRTLGVSFARVGAIMALVLLVSGIVGPMLGGVLADACQRRGGPRQTAVALAVLAVLAAPTGLYQAVPGVASASIILCAALTLMTSVAVMGTTLFTIVVPNELRGLCTAILVAANILFALGVAPVAVSLLSGALGGLNMIGEALAVVLTAVSLLAATSFALGRRSLPPDLGDRVPAAARSP